ncbi:unnamed protein product [Cuscuta epithymum]|uniref:Cyclin n=1 Tax=Cuscuta epithymum TaxID=186058 RepID=A0AAV0EV95_9ASTE|nr:unnamed protein product [Cuscuta epithymum]
MAELVGQGVMPPKLITYLSSLLQRVADSNDLTAAEAAVKKKCEAEEEEEAQKVSVFHGLTRPGISVRSYLERIFRYANCSPSCFVVAYVYLDRFSHRHPALPINSFNVHRLLITSVMVAAKFMDDMYYNNAYYAKVGGISTTEMNFLEVDFLFGLGFHLNVTPITFQTYCEHLQREMLLLHPSPSDLAQPSSAVLCTGRSAKEHHKYICFNDDETSHQQQHQLAV